MKDRYQKIVQIVRNEISSNEDSTIIREYDLYISVYYAIIFISKQYNIDTVSSSKIFKRQFTKIYQEFDSIRKNIRESIIVKINNSIEEFFIDSVNDVNAISWLYQYIKKSFEKKAFNKTGKNKNKLSGDDLLLTTQFFTDQYMVEYLIDRVFEVKKDYVKDSIFVDPAVGGGNFLLYAFEKYFEYYKNETCLEDFEICKYILDNKLYAFDLDPHLAKIAAISLWLKVSTKCKLEEKVTLYIFGGKEEDQFGSLNSIIRSNKIMGKSFFNILKEETLKNTHILYITNPPFMGKRDMDLNLKDFLQNNFPESKGDLCVSFLQRFLNVINSNSIVATVTQNGWLNLKSFKDFRKIILTDYHLLECVDLGSHAFSDISGEKTNIILSIIERKKDSDISQFINLKNIDRKDKEIRISNHIFNPIIINCECFLKNDNFEISYQKGTLFTNLGLLPKYESFARTMQGTSTGNNAEFVKFTWEKVDNPDDWVNVSKGGGYSKWHGLNIYKVKWGKNASLIKQNQGSAVRNLNMISKTQLVYSDTGSLGLSVRFLEKDQVFIASGPGILVKRGKPICHLAVLNSKFISFLLHIINPKYTISAGYISQLPIPEDLLTSGMIETLASKCSSLKRAFLKRKLPNLEYQYKTIKDNIDIDAYIISLIASDFDFYYKIFIIEKEIEDKITMAYNLTSEEKSSFTEYSGYNIRFNQEVDFLDANILDNLIDKLLNVNCVFVPKKINNYQLGTENLLEYMSYLLKIDINNLYQYLMTNVNQFKKVIQKYKDDFLHKAIIHSLTSLEEMNTSDIDIEEIREKVNSLMIHYTGCNFEDDDIKHVITKVHSKSFYNTPYLFLKDNKILVRR